MTNANNVYCTYFDRGYLPRALTLIESMRMHGDTSLVLILALDQEVASYFERYPVTNTKIIGLDELEKSFPELEIIKQNRSRMEYFFTCTPLLIKYCLRFLRDEKDTVIYLDADLYFFQSPQIVLSELGDSSVGIIEHKYNKRLDKKLSKYGTYNVGWLGFKNDLLGQEVLNWYAQSTINWCFDKPEDGKYADQGYLNWFLDFEGVKVLKPLGYNLAPWNSKNYSINYTNYKVWVNSDPLVFFHFHGLKKIGKRYFTSQLIYRAPMGKILRERVYLHYIITLDRNERIVLQRTATSSKSQRRGNGAWGLIFRIYKSGLNFASIVLRQTIKVD